MKKIILLVIIICGFQAKAQNKKIYQNVKLLMLETQKIISIKKGQKIDTAYFRTLFLPTGNFTVVGEEGGKKLHETMNINEFIELYARKLDGRDINYVDGEINSIHSLHKGDNYFTKFAAKESVKKAAEVLLDAKAELRGAELFAKPAKIGLPSPMHQDNFYWCVKGNNALTMWVALDYCNKDNGGLTYYRGSQKLGLLNHVDSHAPGSSQKVEDKYLNQLGDAAAVTPSVEPGDVLVHNSLMIHGSSAN